MPKNQRISRKISSSANLSVDNSAIKLVDHREPTGVTIRSKDGVDRIEVVFATPEGRRQHITFIPLHRRDLCAGFAEAFYNWGVDKTPGTRSDKKRFLDAFFDFLADRETRNPTALPIGAVSQIDSAILNQYVVWLDEPKYHSRGQHAGHRAPWALKSRCMHFSIVSQMIAWIKENRRSSLPDKCEVPWAPWPTATQKVEATKILTPQEGALIERACLEEIEATWGQFCLGQKLLASRPDEAPLEHQALAELLHLMVTRGVSLGMGPPIGPILRKTALLSTYQKFGNGEGMAKFFCATARSLVPFIVYVASRTFFNSEALLGADRSAILAAHPLLEERKVVRVAKGRAGKFQRRSFDARRTQSVPNIIDRAFKLTAPLVPYAEGALGTRLFLFRKLTSPFLPQAYVGADDKLDTWFWHTNLRAFRDHHALPYFTLGNLRHTGSDRTHEASNGDLKASQIVLGHVSADTTFAHYRSDGMKRRDQEKIARVQGRFVDWLREGQDIPTAIVLRDIPEITAAEAEAISVGKNATSSGFTCKNPYDSPMPGQRQGKLCSAWLGCFACPNALIERNAQTLARLLQLKIHLSNSRLNIDPKRFSYLYEHKLRILEDDILPQFTDTRIHEFASSLISFLPPLPDIE